MLGGLRWVQDRLPEAISRAQVLGVSVRDWVGLLAIALVAGCVAWVVGAVARSVALRLAARSRSRWDDRLVDKLGRPCRLLVGFAFFAAAVRAGDFAADVESRALHVAAGLAVVAATWLVMRGIDLFAKKLHDDLLASGRRSAAAMLPLVRRGIKLFLLVIALVALLQNVGLNVTGLLAGLGVGGLAVALAAQKSIANLFGGVSLIADQPVRVGDFCRFADGKTGTVEDIGLRSTRIRTLDRTLVSIPNAEFSEFQIENYGARDRIRLLTHLGLRYETTPVQLRRVLGEMRDYLASHPRVDPVGMRVNFVALGAHALEVEVAAYTTTTVWEEFLAIREEILLRFLEIAREGGTGFAFPSRTVYLTRDAGVESPSAPA